MFSFPACNPITGRILPICSNRCGVVNFVIGECSLEFFRNDPEFPNVNRLLDIFVCDQPESYYNFPLQYIETMDPDDCSSIGWYIHTYMSNTKVNITTVQQAVIHTYYVIQHHSVQIISHLLYITQQ